MSYIELLHEFYIFGFIWPWNVSRWSQNGLIMTHQDLFGTFSSILDQRRGSTKQFWLSHVRNLTILRENFALACLKRVRKSILCISLELIDQSKIFLFYLRSRGVTYTVVCYNFILYALSYESYDMTHMEIALGSLSIK